MNDEIIGNFAKNGLRTFAYAYKDIDSDHWEDLQANNNNFIEEKDRYIVERDLTFVAGFGIQDDLREGVAMAINKLKLAGINTRMVSGDNLETAIYAAKKAGILVEGEEKAEMRCMTGEEFSNAVGEVRKVVGKDGSEKWVVSEKNKFKKIA